MYYHYEFTKATVRNTKTILPKPAERIDQDMSTSTEHSPTQSTPSLTLPTTSSTIDQSNTFLFDNYFPSSYIEPSTEANPYTSLTLPIPTSETLYDTDITLDEVAESSNFTANDTQSSRCDDEIWSEILICAGLNNGKHLRQHHSSFMKIPNYLKVTEEFYPHDIDCGF